MILKQTINLRVNNEPRKADNFMKNSQQATYTTEKPFFKLFFLRKASAIFYRMWLSE